MISTGAKARKKFYGKDGGPRSALRAKHGGKYVERPGIMGGKTRAQKIKAREEQRRRNKGQTVHE